MDARTERFERLYWAHHRDVLSFLRRRIGPDAAEDALAETYVVAWRRIDDIPPQERPWLFGVARNVIRDTQRREERRGPVAVPLSEDLTEGSAGIEDAFATRADLVAAWKQLTAAEQEVLALAAWDGLSNTEAAKVIGVNSNTYAVRLFRARKRLLHLVDHAGERGRT